MDRLVQRNVLAMSGRAVEAAGDVQTLLLDKTGHDHARQPDGVGLLPGPRTTPKRRWPTPPSWRRWPTRRPRVGPSWSWPRSASTSASGSCPSVARVRAVLGDDPDVGTRRRWPPDPQGCGRLGADLGGRAGGHAARGLDEIVDRIARAGSTPLVVADGPVILGVIELKDVVKDGHRGEVRRDAPDGHPHGDDHRRQPADRGGHRPGGRRRRLPGRGDARGEDGADPAGAGGRASSSP